MIFFKECYSLPINICPLFVPPRLEINQGNRFILYKNHNEVLSSDAIDMFSRFDLSIEKVILFSCAAKTPLTSIHIDGCLHLSEPTGSINYILPSCDSWAVQFFECNMPTGMIISSEKNNFIKFDHSNCRILESIMISRPFLMRVDIPHRAVNLSNNEMHCVNIRFSNNDFYKLLKLC